jgi:hypothetical protein
VCADGSVRGKGVDLYKAIRMLYEEKKRLDRLIESLEDLQTHGNGAKAPAAPSRRGRRMMTAEERLQVSERMRKYWSQRRDAKRPRSSAAAGEPVNPLG